MNQTSKLVEALKKIESLCDGQNETHAGIWHVAQQALESYKDGWVSVEEGLPDFIKGETYSENVIAWLDGERKIMCYSLVPDDDNNLCHAWCMVYDGLDGDGEFDDNYYPTHWQPLPTPPQTTTI